MAALKIGVHTFPVICFVMLDCVTKHLHLKGITVNNKERCKMYELDDGPLSQEQIELIRKISTCSAISCTNFTEKLFPIDDNLVEISD